MFSEKLKQAMQDLHLNQVQVCGLTGKSKGSISQYLSGKQVPSEDVQRSIAVALGLASDYFAKPEKGTTMLPKTELRNKVIERLDVCEADKTVADESQHSPRGTKAGRIPVGYAIHTSDNRWTYFINAKRFAEIEGL